jgi:hypothetical protein
VSRLWADNLYRGDTYRFESCPDYQVNHTKTRNVVTAWKDTHIVRWRNWLDARFKVRSVNEM